MKTIARHLIVVAAGLLLGAGALGCAWSGESPGDRQNKPPIDQKPSQEREEGSVANQEKVRDELIEAHNAERKKDKLPPFNPSHKLQTAAQAHADDMARRKKMSHEGADGSSPFDRIKEAGYRYRKAAENVAYTSRGVTGVMKIWMESPPHRKNILGGYSQIGAACATASDGTVYWCVTFGLPR
jgi:uncharacterized protein YkwD